MEQYLQGPEDDNIFGLLARFGWEPAFREMYDSLGCTYFQKGSIE